MRTGGGYGGGGGVGVGVGGFTYSCVQREGSQRTTKKLRTYLMDDP